MAQLPPKVPNMAPNWPDLPSHSHHQKLPSMENLSHAAHEFDKFDEEQFMAMFTDDEAVGLSVACSGPSSPPDHNSMEDDLVKPCTTTSTDQKMQLECGVRSHNALEGQNAVGDGVATIDNYKDNNFDPTRVKRILANRQSAQRSRVRKLQYISELEHGVNSLQAEISVLSPRVAFLDHQRLVLNGDNSVLRQRIAALSQDKVFKDGYQEALKREIERLRQMYNYQQNVKTTGDDDTAPPSAKSLIQTSPEKITEHPNCSAFNEQITIRC